MDAGRTPSESGSQGPVRFTHHHLMPIWAIAIFTLAAIPVAASAQCATQIPNCSSVEVAEQEVEQLNAELIKISSTNGDRDAQLLQLCDLIRDHINATTIMKNTLGTTVDKLRTNVEREHFERVLPAYIVSLYADRFFLYMNGTPKVIAAREDGPGSAHIKTQYVDQSKRVADVIVWILKYIAGTWKIVDLKYQGELLTDHRAAQLRKKLRDNDAKQFLEQIDSEAEASGCRY